jgi:starch-binding outer membrane protein, SusD/RagB family
MKTRYFFLFALFIALYSCTKLDEEVYDKIPADLYPETANQIANLSVDAYAKLKDMADDGGWWYLAQEISSDELCGPTRGADWYDGGKWVNMYQHTWSNDNEGVNRMWSLFWNGITTCNQTIDLMRTLQQNEALTMKMKELEVLRSFYYYLLIDNYGDVPYLTSAKNAPAQPYKLKRAMVFDSLVNVLTTALPSLKAVDKKYMATRYMAFALLTKLYLNAEVYTGIPKWQEASMYCDSVLAGPYSMESNLLAPFLTNNQNSKEIIFSIPYDEDNFQGFRLHMRTLHYQHNLKYNMPVGPWNGFCVVPTFFDTYQAADKRKTGYFIYGPQLTSNGIQIIDGATHQPLIIDPHVGALSMAEPAFTPFVLRCSGARVGKYEIKMGAKENLSNDLPLFRITDFYFIKAEVVMRQGGSGDEWINPIRVRAGVSAWSGMTGWTGATSDSLLAERGRELFCEGVRRQDLIRYGKWENGWWEKAATGKDREIFPIPKWATDANPNLLKNP